MKALQNTIHTNRKKLFSALVLGIMVLFTLAVTAFADDDPKPRKIFAVGKKTVTVTAGEEFKLRVRTAPYDADDDYLRWKITSGSKFVRFDDNDRSDDEIEMIAQKKGTAKVTCSIRGTKKKVTFTIKVKDAKTAGKKIKIIGPEVRTIEAGDDFELKIKKYRGLSDRSLKWSIRDTSIVRFDDDDRYDDEVEFHARKIGSTTVTCKNTKTGQSVTFTVKVSPRSQMNYDDNDYDDWDDRYDDDRYDD